MSTDSKTTAQRDAGTVQPLVGHRITIWCNGRVLAAASIDHDPQTMDQISAVLRDMASMLDGPHEPIPEFEHVPNKEGQHRE